MRDTPLDILDRTRNIFLASLGDSIGKADAGADFYYATLSAERKGYDLDSRDQGLIKMFYSVMKDENSTDDIGGFRYNYDLEAEAAKDAQQASAMATAGAGEQSVRTYLGHQSGQQLSDNPSYDENRIAPAMNPEIPNDGFSGKHVDMVDGETDDPYRTHNFFDKRFNPLADRYHEHVGDFYVADDSKSEPQSQIDAGKEMLWEKYHEEGPQTFLRNHNHYGKLNEHGTNHALYEQDYQNWAKSDEFNRVSLALEEQGITDESELKHELRKIHIADKKAEWKDNLGFLDYMFGMEWLTPEQRNKAYEHMIQHGTSNDNRPLRFNTHDGNPNFVPRLKRNLQQRLIGMYNMWTRPPGYGCEAMKNRPIRLPEDAEKIKMLTNLDVMQRSQTMGHPNHMHRVMAHLINNTGEDEGEDGPQSMDHVPYIHTDSDGQKTMQFHSPAEGRKRGLSREALHHLLNVDNSGRLIDSNGAFTQDEVDEVLSKRKSAAARDAGAGRIARKSGIMHFGTFADSEYYPDFYTDEQREAGDNTTLSTYWQRPFFKGGMGKQRNDFFNLLHHHGIIPQHMLEKLGQEQSEEETEEDEAPEELDPYSDEGFEQLMAARDAEPETQSEEEEEVVKPKKSRRERSLLFERTGNGIFIHHDFDKDGKVEDSKMISALAPMGQPTHELGRAMVSTGKDSFKEVTESSIGDDTDAESNFNDDGVLYSGSIKGTSGKRNVARNMLSHDPKYHNEILQRYHEARESGDDATATAMHDILRGKKGNALPVVHPRIHRGSVYDPEPSMRLNSHAGHSIGTMTGMANPPMSPAATIQEIGHAATTHTVYDPEDMERLKTISTDPQRLDDAIREKEKEITESPGERTTQKLEAELEELQRLVEYKPHEPTTSLFDEHDNPTGFGNRKVMDMNPPGDVSMLSPPQEHLDPKVEEQYVSLSEQRGNLEAEFDSHETSEERKDEIRSELVQHNTMLEELERQIPETTRPPYAGGGHVPGMIRDKLSADLDAISEAGAHLRKMMGADYDDLFSSDLPLETIEANIRMLARMANDYLSIAPHDNHGIHTQGMGEHGEEKVMAGAATSYNVKETVHNSPTRFTFKDLQDVSANNKQGIAEVLGLDINDVHVKQNLDEIFGKDRVKGVADAPTSFVEGFFQQAKRSGDISQFGIPMMTVGQYMKASGMVDSDMDFEHEIGLLKTRSPDRNVELLEKVRNLSNQLRPQDRAGMEGTQQLNDKLGFDFHLSHNPDPKYEGSKQLSPSRGSKDDKKKSKAYRTQQILDSVIFSNPEAEPQKETSVESIRRGLGKVPVDAFGPDSHTVQSLYNSAGYQHEFGAAFHPTFDYHIRPNGEVAITRKPKGIPMRLVQPMQGFWDVAVPHLRDPTGVDMLHPDYTHHDGTHRSALNTLDRMGAQFKPSHIDQSTRNQDRVSFGKSEIGLADLTNPDIIRKELGKEVPLLQPMHRIFELDDLEHLRGFTGDWIVSVMPEGERGFVKKEDDEISAKPFTLSKEDKENFKKVSSDDFHIDVIKLEDGYYIFDVLEFDDKEVHDTLLDDRMKILRGGMEGVENIHVPSASDTRLTDDAGLALIVEDLQKEHEKLLLRDAKSVYMVGELRHPKWVMLNPGNDVVLRVLERRGNSPYTYRLGTGPITQEDELGDRAVESGGDTYMDVGAAFDSSEKFNEGDHVRVNVANVGEMETSDGQKIYTVSGSDIKEEAESEGLVSQETLGLLAKSDSVQWLCEVSRATSGVRVMMPQGDVVYKCTQSGRSWTVHSPLASSSYLIRLSESQRQYWSPVAGALLKAGLEIKEEVHENGGFGSDSVEPAEPLVKPKKVKDTDWWDEEKKKVLVKGLQLVEKLLKSGAGAVGQSSTGTMGLGIGYATPIESPTGPTNLHDEKTMPDFDNRKRPGEDFSIEPETEDSEPAKHITIPVDGGVIEVTEDSAVLHT